MPTRSLPNDISQEFYTVKKKTTSALFFASYICPTSFSCLLPELFVDFHTVLVKGGFISRLGEKKDMPYSSACYKVTNLRT